MAGTTYRVGDTAPMSGLYEVTHYQHRFPHRVTLLRGDQFPTCSRCGARVAFALAEAADHIAMDSDFKHHYWSRDESAA